MVSYVTVESKKFFLIIDYELIASVYLDRDKRNSRMELLMASRWASK